jgi:hypothetical protein
MEGPAELLHQHAIGGIGENGEHFSNKTAMCILKFCKRKQT